MKALFLYLWTSLKSLFLYAMGRPLDTATPWSYLLGVVLLLLLSAAVMLPASLLLSKKKVPFSDEEEAEPDEEIHLPQTDTPRPQGGDAQAQEGEA